MNLPVIATLEQGEPYPEPLTWWSLEAEIDLLRRILSSLPMGAIGVFLAALHVAAAAPASSAEVSVAELVGESRDPRGSDSVHEIERAIGGVLHAEGVVSDNRDAGREHMIPADMVLSEEEKIVLSNAGARAGLLYRPEAGIHGRISVRVSAICPMGLDLSAMEA